MKISTVNIGSWMTVAHYEQAFDYRLQQIRRGRCGSVYDIFSCRSCIEEQKGIPETLSFSRFFLVMNERKIVEPATSVNWTSRLRRQYHRRVEKQLRDLMLCCRLSVAGCSGDARRRVLLLDVNTDIETHRLVAGSTFTGQYFPRLLQ